MKTSSERRSSQTTNRKAVRELKAPKREPVISRFRNILSDYLGEQIVPATKGQQALPRRPKSGSRLQPDTGLFKRAFSWIHTRSTAPKQLRVSETVSLGEKRFVAILHAEGQKFLIGGGASNVSLLTRLDEAPQAPDTLGSLAMLAEVRK